MFTMIQGPWPRVTADGVALADLEAAVAAGTAEAAELAAATERLVAEVLAAQAEAGIDLLTDGQVRWPDLTDAVRLALLEGRLDAERPLVAAWRAAVSAAPAGAAVAQAVPGPYTLGWRALEDAVRSAHEAGDPVPEPAGRTAARFEVTLGIADSLAREIAALAAAGCPMVVVEEPEAVAIGAAAAERTLFANASARLLADAGGTHAMLAVTGGSAHEAGGPTFFEAPWQSILVDLIAGPDNWKLVRQAPGSMGVVCAALRVREDGLEVDRAPELVWAAKYAASANGRGLERVGLANATRLVACGPGPARAALGQLTRAAGLAVLPLADAVEAGLDRRTILDGRPVPATSNRAARRRAARAERDEPPQGRPGGRSGA